MLKIVVSTDDKEDDVDVEFYQLERAYNLARTSDTDLMLDDLNAKIGKEMESRRTTGAWYIRR